MAKSRTSREHPLEPLCKAWKAKVEEAKKAPSRKEFDEIAEQCLQFFCGATGFMWTAKYAKFTGGSLSPRFKFTLARGFELVAVYGPNLYWRNPQRAVRETEELPISWENYLPPGFVPQPPPQLPPPPPEDAPPEVLQDYQAIQQQAQQPPPEVQYAQQRMQQTEMMRGIRAQDGKMRDQLTEGWLNYTPREQSGGGLSQHSEFAITEALVTGRGILMPKWYRKQGSQKKLTGCFWVPQDTQWWDPDATSTDNAWWMVIQEDRHHWDVEQEFGLERNSLKDYCTTESGNSRGGRASNYLNKTHRNQGKTKDTLVVYKIWSRMGIGARLSGLDKDSLKDLISSGESDRLDPVVGDHAYIVIVPGCPYPLNCPDVTELDDEEVERAFRWDTPYWLDDKWPISLLEFYKRPGSPYPIAPIAPGLGELAYINLFMSHAANRIWSSCRDFWAVSDEIGSVATKILEGGKDQAIIPIPAGVRDFKEKLINIVQPATNGDLFTIMDNLSATFDKRVGLPATLYGLSEGAESRSAQESKQKQQFSNVRMQYMASKTDAWQAEVADSERWCMRWNIEAPDIVDRFGEEGMEFWTRYITDTEPEQFLREARATVEADSARPPNKEKDVENVAQLMQMMGAEYSKHADVTGSTDGFNALMELWHDANDQKMDPRMELGPRVPQAPPPEVLQQQQQQMQLEMAKLQAEVQKLQVEAQVKGMDMQLKQLEAQGMGQEQQTKAAEAQQEIQLEQMRTGAKLQLSKVKSDAQLQLKADSHRQDLEQKQVEGAMNMRQKQVESAVNLRSKMMEHAQKMKAQAAQSEAQIIATLAQAKAKPKPSANGSKG